MYLNGIGPAVAAVMTREVYYRQFDNRRQVAGFLGLAPCPYDSGDGGAITRDLANREGSSTRAQ